MTIMKLRAPASARPHSSRTTVVRYHPTDTHRVLGHFHEDVQDGSEPAPDEKQTQPVSPREPAATVVLAMATDDEAPISALPEEPTQGSPVRKSSTASKYVYAVAITLITIAMVGVIAQFLARSDRFTSPAAMAATAPPPLQSVLEPSQERSAIVKPADAQSNRPQSIAPEAAGQSTIVSTQGATLIAPQAQAEHLTSRQTALPLESDRGNAPSTPPAIAAGPISTRIAQMTCQDQQPVLLSLAVFNAAASFDRAVPSLKDWTGRQNGVVLFDTQSRPNSQQLEKVAREAGLVVMTFSDPDTRVQRIDDENAMSWFVFSEQDISGSAGRPCVVRLFSR